MSERLFVRLDGDSPHGPESTTPAGTLQAGRISLPLRPYVSQVLTYCEAHPAGAETLERVLPDGAVRLVFNLGDTPSGLGCPVQVLGASAAPALVRLRGRMEGVSVALRPGAALALLGLPAGELEGRAVDLDALWGGAGARVLEQMAEAPDDAARIAVLEQSLLRRVQRSEASGRQKAARAAQRIADAGGRIRMRDAAAWVGVGERRLQQLFHDHVGLTPRAWSRLARLHACLRALRRQPARGLSSVAAEVGYFDQAHLANEFRSLCGLSPSELLAHAVSGSSKTSG